MSAADAFAVIGDSFVREIADWYTGMLPFAD